MKPAVGFILKGFVNKKGLFVKAVAVKIIIDKYTNNCQPSNPITGEAFVSDTRVRFELQVVMQS